MCLRGYLLVTKQTQIGSLEKLVVSAEQVMRVASCLLHHVLLNCVCRSVVVHSVLSLLLHQLIPKLVCHVHCLACLYGQVGLQPSSHKQVHPCAILHSFVSSWACCSWIWANTAGLSVIHAIA